MLERTDYSSVESSEEPYAYRGRRASHLPPAPPPPPPAQAGPGPYRGPSDVSETTSSFGTHDPYVEPMLANGHHQHHHQPKHLKTEVNKIAHAQRVGRRSGAPTTTTDYDHPGDGGKGNIYESVAYAERQRKLHQPKGGNIFSRHQLVTTIAGNASCGSTSSSEDFSSSSPGRGGAGTSAPAASSARPKQSSSGGEAHRRRHQRHNHHQHVGGEEVAMHAHHRRKQEQDFVEVLDGYDLDDYDHHHQHHHRENYYNSPFSW